MGAHPDVLHQVKVRISCFASDGTSDHAPDCFVPPCQSRAAAARGAVLQSEQALHPIQQHCTPAGSKTHPGTHQARRGQKLLAGH